MLQIRLVHLNVFNSNELDIHQMELKQTFHLACQVELFLKDLVETFLSLIQCLGYNFLLHTSQQCKRCVVKFSL